MTTFNLDLFIGPLGIRIVCSNEQLLEDTKRALPDYVASDLGSPRVLSVSCFDEPPPVAGQFLGVPERIDEALDGNGRQAFKVYRDKMRKRHVSNGHGVPRGIIQLLRVALDRWLPTEGGLLLHAAAVVTQGFGMLVPGDPSAGKSTFAQLSEQVLADEWSLVFKDSSGWRLSGAPHPSQLCDLPGISHNLNIGLLPRHGEKPRLVPVGRRVAIFEIMRQVSRRHRGTDLVADCLAVATQISKDVPFFEFWYPPTTSSVLFLVQELRMRGLR